MFNLFKFRKETEQSRAVVIISLYEGIDVALKGVENSWKIGNQKEGDELLLSFAKTCLSSLIRDGIQIAPEGQRLQLSLLKKIIGFLQKHRKIDLLTKFMQKLELNITRYSGEDLMFIQYYMDLYKGMLQAKNDIDQPVLAYYICQFCGCPTLLATAPCIRCGSCSSTEKELRRAFLLNSMVLDTPYLIEISKYIHHYSNEKDGIQPLDKAWIQGNVDDVASLKTQNLNDQIPSFLSTCKKHIASNMKSQLKFNNRCEKCQSINGFNIYSKDQICTTCEALVIVPRLRSVRARLYTLLITVFLTSDPQDGRVFGNFIATFVLITDYTIRRNELPPKLQSMELIDRFLSVSPLTFNKGIFQLTIEKSTVIMSVKNASEASDKDFHKYKMLAIAFNQLFDLLKSNEMSS